MKDETIYEFALKQAKFLRDFDEPVTEERASDVSIIIERLVDMCKTRAGVEKPTYAHAVLDSLIADDIGVHLEQSVTNTTVVILNTEKLKEYRDRYFDNRNPQQEVQQ